MVQTAVSAYILDKLENFKRDKFLKNIKYDSLTEQAARVSFIIFDLTEYIDRIKSNNQNYIIKNGEKILLPFVVKKIEECEHDLERYNLYYDYIDIIENYANRPQRLDNKIKTFAYDFQLDDKQDKILSSINDVDLNTIEL